MIAYPAILDVPRELVLELAKLLRAERRVLGTRKGTRLLTCFRQALFVLVWFRTKGDVEIVGAGSRVPSAHGRSTTARPIPRLPPVTTAVCGVVIPATCDTRICWTYAVRPPSRTQS